MAFGREGFCHTWRIFEVRVPRLIQLKQIKEEGGRLKIGGRLVLSGARLLAVFRQLLGIPVRPKLVEDTGVDPTSLHAQWAIR